MRALSPQPGALRASRCSLWGESYRPRRPVRRAFLRHGFALFAGNKNIRNNVAAFCGLLNGLAAEAEAAVLFIGHPNKAGSDFSGSTAWENQVRSRIFLETPKAADGSFTDPDARMLSRAKSNYARRGETIAFRWHRWAVVREEDLAPGEADAVAESILARIYWRGVGRWPDFCSGAKAQLDCRAAISAAKTLKVDIHSPSWLGGPV